MTDVSTRELRLAEVVKDLQELREEWESMGRPKLIRTASMDMRPHPLIKLIRDSEELVERMSRPLEAAVGGRPRGAASAPDRAEPKSSAPPKRTQLRAVGE
jgi:hypothetical protein